MDLTKKQKRNEARQRRRDGRNPGRVVLVAPGAGGRSPSRPWVGSVAGLADDGCSLRVDPLEIGGQLPDFLARWTSVVWEHYVRSLRADDLVEPGGPLWEGLESPGSTRMRRGD